MAANSTTSSVLFSNDDTRAIADIVWTCCVTIALCCWTTVYINIPSDYTSRWEMLYDKANLACIGLFGPDFLVGLAAGQWHSARQSKKDFHALGCTTWTTKHGFYADMGGFRLKLHDYEEFVIDAKQLHYLVENKYINFPEAKDLDLIRDRNKSDGFARFITICQVLVFSTKSIVRAVQGIGLTTLELTTLAFAVSMFVASFFWFDKPKDVENHLVIETETTINQILKDENISPEWEFTYTPLDFVSRREWSVPILWSYYCRLNEILRIPVFQRRSLGKPATRIRSDNFPFMSTKLQCILTPFLLAYSSIFLVGWNFEFPTTTERYLWRIAALITISFPILTAMVFLPADHLYFKGRRPNIIPPGRSSANIRISGKSKLVSGWGRFLDKARNVHTEKDHMLEVPLRILIPSTIVCAAYSISRAYILLEDLLSLRDLPPKLLQSIRWYEYLPHL